jgi:Amidohydrolase
MREFTTIHHPVSRRVFLAALAATPRAAPRSPVVDTHMHVWTNDVAHFPFAHPYDSNFKPPPVAGSVEMLLDEMDRHAIGYAVLVQVIYYGWDNAYVAHCVKRHPQRFRAQGLIDPTDPQVASKLEYWMREHRLTGMRFSPIYYQGRDEWITSDAHRRLWKKAEALKAIFNFFIAANQLAKLETMLADYPGVKVVIDHLARVDLTAADPAQEVAVDSPGSISQRLGQGVGAQHRFAFEEIPLCRHLLLGETRLRCLRAGSASVGHGLPRRDPRGSGASLSRRGACTRSPGDSVLVGSRPREDSGTQCGAALEIPGRVE